MWQQPHRDAHVRSLLETTGHAHEDHSLIGHVARTPYVFSRHVNTSLLSNFKPKGMQPNDLPRCCIGP